MPGDTGPFPRAPRRRMPTTRDKGKVGDGDKAADRAPFRPAYSAASFGAGSTPRTTCTPSTTRVNSSARARGL